MVPMLFMVGAAQQCTYRIAERTFDPVPIELAVRFQRPTRTLRLSGGFSFRSGR